MLPWFVAFDFIKAEDKGIATKCLAPHLNGTLPEKYGSGSTAILVKSWLKPPIKFSLGNPKVAISNASFNDNSYNNTTWMRYL